MADSPFLLTPGPVPVPPEVLAIQGNPQQHHRSAAFVATYSEVLRKLKLVFRTEHDVLLFTASGTGAFESVFANTVEAGDRVLCVTGWRVRRSLGVDGAALRRRRHGARVRVGQAPPDPARRRRGDGGRDAEAGRRRALGDLDGDGHGHPEDRRALARPQLPARDRRRLEPRRGADRDRRLGSRLVVSGTQKGMSTPPGLSFASVSPAAWERSRRPRRRASTSTGSARSTRRTAAEARSRPRPRPSTRSTSRSTSCSRRASRRSGSARARWRVASAPACSPRGSGSTRPTTSRARS